MDKPRLANAAGLAAVALGIPGWAAAYGRAAPFVSLLEDPNVATSLWVGLGSVSMLLAIASATVFFRLEVRERHRANLGLACAFGAVVLPTLAAAAAFLTLKLA